MRRMRDNNLEIRIAAPFAARSKIIVDSRSRRNVCLALKSFVRLGLDGGQQLIAPQNTVKFRK